jgi:hypothetical protein
MSQNIEPIRRCTISGYLYGIICPQFGVYDLISDADIYAVRSKERAATANHTGNESGDSKTVLRTASEDEIKRLGSGSGALIGRTDKSGFFCLNDASYEGELVDVYVCLRAVPGPEKLLPLKRTTCLFVGTFAPRRRLHGWYFNLFIPQTIWCGLKKQVDAWTVAGRVATCDGDSPVGSATVIARDVDCTQSDLLGQAVTNGLGIFRIDYMGDAFRKGTFIDVELFGGPDLYFEVHDSGGNPLLTEDPSAGRQFGRCDSGPCKCVRVCVDTPPPVTHAWFTHVGDFEINFDIDPTTGLSSQAANIGLPNEHAGPGYAFFDGDHGWGIKLVGDCPKLHPAGGEPMRYRFLYEDLDNDPGVLHPITAAMLSGVVVGSRPITWDPFGLGTGVFAQSIIVGPTGDEIPPGPTPPPPGPPVGSWGPIPNIYLKPDADGWVTMDPTTNLNGYSGPLLYFRTAAVVAGGGAPNDGVGNAVSDQKVGRPLRIVFEAEPTTGPTISSLTLGNELPKLMVNNWSEVILLDLEEFVAANCCSPIDASLGILYTADHQFMLNWGVGISSCASGMGWVAPALPPAVLPPSPPPSGASARGGFGTSRHNTAAWPNCSYVVSIGTTRKLTDGEDEADGSSLQKTFCIEH